MKIELDHIQRLNLHALLGAQRGDVATVRALWALQDKLALSPEEEQAIDLKREFVGGQERVVWNSTSSIPAKEYDFSDREVARIRAAIHAWDLYGVNTDRRWLEPVIEALVPDESHNHAFP